MTRSLFDLVVPIEATSREFRHIREYAGFTAGRRLMDEIFAEFRDVDRSFVRQFQTGGFSPRVFELALFAYLKEQGYDLDPSSPAPDFVVRGDVPVAMLPLGALRDITEHQLRDDGLVLTTLSRLDPFVSKTLVLHSRGVDLRELLRRELGQAGEDTST